MEPDDGDDLAAAVTPASPDRPRRLTVVGRVVEGVEPGSVVLHADDGRMYQLGPVHAGLDGLRVTVTGTVPTGTSTVAQQGGPLRVERVSLDDAGG